MKRYMFGCLFVLCGVAAGCGGSSSGGDDTGGDDAGSSSGPAVHKDASTSSGTTDTVHKDAGPATGTGPSTGTGPADAGHKDAGSSTSQTPADSGTAHVDAGTSATPDAGGTTSGGGTNLTGTLGTTGAIKPIVSSLVISNSGETLIYMTTAPLTCQQLTMSRWLGSFTTGAQVIEIVVSGPAKVGAATFPEVNWATGGKSSAYEQSVAPGQGMVTFTKAEAMGVVEG